MFASTAGWSFVGWVPKRALPGLVLFAAIVNSSAAQDTNAASLTEQIDKAVQQQIKTYNVPGLSIAVTREGQIFFSKSYGLADLENNVPATAETRFRIGSITKTITATATLMLAEKGQLDLDAPVQRYCPAFPEKQWPVTTRELLAHVGGVRAFRNESGIPAELFSNAHYDKVGDELPLFANDPLVAKPGTQYEYSYFGYDLIGCVLEGASRKSFADLLQELIFLRAGMNSTTVDDSLLIIPHRSRSYSHTKDGSIRNAKSIDLSNRIPGAGLLSTADDLAHFVFTLESGKLLSAEMRRQMWTEQVTENGKSHEYALGWMVHRHNGQVIVAHTGEQPGSSTILCVLPDREWSFAVLTNVDAAGLWKLADRLADLLAP